MFYKLALTTLITSVAAASLMPIGAYAERSSDLRMIPVIVNGQKVKFPDTEPYIDLNGRTMVPVRFVSEKLGADVQWKDADQSVTITYDGKSIKLPLGSKQVYVNGSAVTLDTEAELTDGRTMVPLRFVSETLSSTVQWDEDAHAVRISDEAYLKKVAAGEVVLDDWGREFSKTWDPNWFKLTDLPDEFYALPTFRFGADGDTNRAFAEVTSYSTGELIVQKQNVDRWAEHIRQFYALMLNVDYRTIDTDLFSEGIIKHMQISQTKNFLYGPLEDFVKWVKDNHVIAQGYADPENSQVRYENAAPVMRTHFKFKVIAADDPSQTFMDNWAGFTRQDVFVSELGVWYDGYADVQLYTNSMNYQSQFYAVGSVQNMFRKGGFVYTKMTE